MTGPAYPAARTAAQRVHARFELARETEPALAAALPCVPDLEALIDAAFWASLRREEGLSPKISLAFLPPAREGTTLAFETPLRLLPEILVRLAPAAERPGIHLGVWREGDDLVVWGATRKIPAFCLVLEVVAPGLLVIKRRRGETPSKFVNVAVIEGDAIKVIDPDANGAPECPDAVSALLGFAEPSSRDGLNVLVELAVSMRAHGRGGALLLTPAGSDAWRESIVQPVHYSISPPFSKLAVLVREPEGRRNQPPWQDAFHGAIETIAGLTSVDGATVINDRYDVLAFGAKIRRRVKSPPVEQALLTEPIEGAVRATVPVVQIGGTRHLSAAQFVHDQRDSVALVASQDGRFTVFGWSQREEIVHAHRVETLLL